MKSFLKRFFFFFYEKTIKTLDHPPKSRSSTKNQFTLRVFVSKSRILGNFICQSKPKINKICRFHGF